MKTLILTLLSLVAIGCNKQSAITTFREDLKLLESVEDLTILQDGDAMIAASGAYQGRIFTSTTKGINGRSLGYFNRGLMGKGSSLNNLTKLGGEGRMWFGPEIGKYAIFFAPNTPQNAHTINVSPDLDTNLFKPIAKTKHSITYGNRMTIRNANSYHFIVDAKRKISLKNKTNIEQELNIQLNEHISHVGFSAETWIKNMNQEQWTKENGLLSVWDISCILPTPLTTVIIPSQSNIDSVSNYFTPLNSTRVIIKDNIVYYKADAAYMNKIGIQPEYCKNVFGSYSPEINLLTIVKYHFTKDSLYVNSQWGHEKPYKGDVINIFNGEVNESLDRAWPFYELETSSSAKELQPGEEMYHMHSIYHFEGDEGYLDNIANQVLGVSIIKLSEILK
ncbi:DUF6786 family protein [Saccharicrinis sp. GN24d3]|uniref:DUF6786 family protein n=1 Tax=Saccharicrinis sp. GN24d3 TaxID=3458416 RepID=UPI0040371275